MEFEIGLTDKEITPWGGMALMKRMLDCCENDLFLTHWTFNAFVLGQM